MNLTSLSLTTRRHVLASTLAGGLLLGCSSPALAAFGQQNGQLAFTSERSDANSEVYTLRGGDLLETTPSLERLTRTSGSNDAQPAWSPDGQTLAFICEDASGDQEVCVVGKGGGMPTQITDDTDNAVNTQAHHPSWSPDGSQLVFSATSPDRPNEDIYRINSDGRGRTNLTPNAVRDQNPAWSYDGTKIAYASQRINAAGVPVYQIVVARITPQSERVIDQTDMTANMADSNGPTWSPDGSQLAYYTQAGGLDTDLFRMNIDRTGSTRITVDNGNDTNPAWSPDGKKIAYTSSRNANLDVYTIDSNGNDSVNLNRITSNAAADDSPAWQSVTPPQGDTNVVRTEDSSQHQPAAQTPLHGSSGTPETSALAKVVGFRFQRIKSSKRGAKQALTAQVSVQCPVQTGCSTSIVVTGSLAAKKKTKSQKQVIFARGLIVSKKGGVATFRLSVSKKALDKLFTVAKRNRQKKLIVNISARDQKARAGESNQKFSTTVKIPR